MAHQKHPQATTPKKSIGERIAALENAFNYQAECIGQLLRTNLAMRAIVFAVARNAGLTRTDLQDVCTQFVKAAAAGTPPDAASFASGLDAELSRLLDEYTELLAS